MASWQVFPSLLLRVPLTFLLHTKPPFPSLSNACHTGLRTSQKEFQILAFLHVTGWKINLIRYIFNASCRPINLERWIEIREVMITAYKLKMVMFTGNNYQMKQLCKLPLTIIYNMHIVSTVTLTVIKLKFKLFYYQLWMHTQLGVVHAKPLSVPLRE